MTSGQGDLRILLLGKTGAGKSATGNTILGRNAFKESEIYEKQERVLDGKNIGVIDTPGLFNTSITKEQVKAEIERCVEMSAPGPHVFLLVIKLGVRFTEEERNSVQWIQENFGEEALLRTIILFTHTDLLKGKSLDEYITESHHLLKLVDRCGGRYHSFNNEDRNNQQQVTKLLQKIDALRREHGRKHYTPEMFKRAQTEVTGKDRMNLPKFPYILCVIVLIGVILLGTWHMKREFEKKEEQLQKEKQKTHQLTNELKLKEEQLQKEKQENQELKKEHKHKEAELTNELKLKEELLTKKHKEKEEQLTNELKLKEEQLTKKHKEKEEQLTNELKLKEEQLTKKHKEKEEQLTNELKLKEEQLTKKHKEKEEQLTNELKLKEELLTKKHKEKEEQLTNELKLKEEQLTNELKLKEEQLTKKHKEKEEQLTKECLLKVDEEQLKREVPQEEE